MSGNSSSCSDLEPWKCLDCFIIFDALFISFILLIPLYIFVLYLGYQRWRKQRSGSTSETSSHSDVITYHLVAMEMLCMLGFCFYLHGLLSNQIMMTVVGSYLWAMVSTGQVLFHILTCVDRYLAVVHPVTYLRLRQSGGVRIRNISIGCVWLISTGSMCLVNYPVIAILRTIFMLLSFIAVCFFSLSVLCVLIRPGPGDVSGNKGRVDQSKKRAFQTIMIILVALVIRLLSAVVDAMQPGLILGPSYDCALRWSMYWLSWPSSLVLPLLFLHRVGKLPSCKTNTESGR